MSLCIESGCAFCCDGTLYAVAPLEENEFSSLPDSFATSRQSIKTLDGQLLNHFKLPCKLCIDDKCSIHEQWRPSICGDYQCKLLVNYESGSVAKEKALALINNIKMLRDRLKPQLERIVGVEQGLPLAELTTLLVKQLESKSAERQIVPNQTLLDFGALRILLAKNFDSRLARYTHLSDKIPSVMEVVPNTQEDTSFPNSKK